MAADRPLLLGLVDFSHTALAHLLEDAVWANPAPARAVRLLDGGGVRGIGSVGHGLRNILAAVDSSAWQSMRGRLPGRQTPAGAFLIGWIWYCTSC